MFPKENIPGKYTVDSKCIACALCSEIAPTLFASNLEEGYEYIYRQPENVEEEALCQEAMALCPVRAIGIQDGY